MSGAVVELWTDGACAGNPGPGGWAALLVTGTSERMISGGAIHATNNQMELVAAIEGLKALTRPSSVEIYVDSSYVYRGFAHEHRLVEAWRGRAVDGVWRLASKQPLLNQGLWEQLAAQVERHTILKWQKVPAHAGIDRNERVDAEACAQRDIFRGQVS